jgi:hypothetical protein
MEEINLGELVHKFRIQHPCLITRIFEGLTMHNHTIKIIALLATLVAMFLGAGISQHPMYAASLDTASIISSMNDPAKDTVSLVPVYAKSSYPGDSPEAPIDIFTTSQSLGALDAISWNTLEIARGQPTYSPLSILPIDVELQPQSNTFAVNEVEAQKPNNSHSSSVMSKFGNIQLLYTKMQRAIALYCLTCHVPPDSKGPARSAEGNTLHVMFQHNPVFITACRECHGQGAMLFSSQIRGVE